MTSFVVDILRDKYVREADRCIYKQQLHLVRIDKDTSAASCSPPPFVKLSGNRMFCGTSQGGSRRALVAS